MQRSWSSFASGLGPYPEAVVDSDDQVRWRKDAQGLAQLGSELAGQDLPIVDVRISASIAATAVAAWERDDEGPVPSEDFEQRTMRRRAGSLALIGLAVSERGRWEADGVHVELHPEQIGIAIEVADTLNQGH